MTTDKETKPGLPDGPRKRLYPTVQELRELREIAEKYGYPRDH